MCFRWVGWLVGLVGGLSRWLAGWLVGHWGDRSNSQATDSKAPAFVKQSSFRSHSSVNCSR